MYFEKRMSRIAKGSELLAKIIKQENELKKSKQTCIKVFPEFENDYNEDLKRLENWKNRVSENLIEHCKKAQWYKDCYVAGALTTHSKLELRLLGYESEYNTTKLCVTDELVEVSDEGMLIFMTEIDGSESVREYQIFYETEYETQTGICWSNNDIDSIESNELVWSEISICGKVFKSEDEIIKFFGETIGKQIVYFVESEI